MSDNSQLSDKDLTHKLTVLMALLSTSRASSIQHLNIKFMARNDTPCKFYLHKLHKSWRRDKAPPTVLYEAYTQDPNPCVVKTLDEYISRSEFQRSGEQCSQLLVSFVNPNKLVISSTISALLKNVLRNSGIEIGTFKVHSTRSASTSKKDLSGAPTGQILKPDFWSNKSTCQKFYSKNIIQEGQLFQEMLFK